MDEAKNTCRISCHVKDKLFISYDSMVFICFYCNVKDIVKSESEFGPGIGIFSHAFVQKLGTVPIESVESS